jgi:DNA-binding NarL/FixJ family response regulator
LVLLDLKMPGINGYELGKELKMIDRNINIVVISGYTDPKEIKELIIEGLARSILTKPFDIEELKRIVNNAILRLIFNY